MRDPRLIVVAFFIGLAVRDALRWAWMRVLLWREAKELEAAKDSMAECRHDRAALTDVPGIAREVVVLKCVDCWALRFPFSTDGPEWHPNTTPPTKSERLRAGIREES